MKAVIYARFSSHAQKDASIEQQIRTCKEYAERNDITVVGEYSDRALSGTSDKRPDFQRMIRDAAKGKWERVLVYKVDRFARNRYDSAMYKARLKKHGVKVVSVMEPIPDGPEGILLESVLEGSAEYYSANLSQNILRGMRDNALDCKVNNGRLALGYKKGPDGRYAIDPEGAAIVREIFRMYNEGYNATEITDALNKRGWKTSHGARWNKNSLHSILRNERYTGVYLWKDIRIEDGIPAIITKELFENVQQRRRKVARAPASARTEVDYILTGKLFCGKCKSPMVGESGSGKSGRKFYYYNCIKRKRQKACDKKMVKKDLIEELVVRQIKERCLNKKVINSIATAALELQEREKDDSLLKTLEKNLKQTEKSISNMLDAIEQGIITAGTKARLEELEAKKSDLEIAIIEEKTVQPQLTHEQLVFWLERFRDGDPSDPEYRASFVEVFVSAVYLYDDHLRIVCNYTGENATVSCDIVDNIEDLQSAVKVFDFDTRSSTKQKNTPQGVFFCLV